jgi:iron complex transport system permease protein
VRRLALFALPALAAFVAHVMIGGSVWVAPAEMARVLLAGPGADGRFDQIVWSLRLPRACACVLIGAILGGVGASFQALFRNPLADPFVLGVSSGAAVGGTLAFALGVGMAWFGLGGVACSFLGGTGSLLLVLALARRSGAISVPTLLLAGVVVGSMLSSVMTLVLLTSGEDTNRVLRWLLGSMTPMYWNRVAMLAFALLGLGALIAWSRALNVMAVDEGAAERLGVDPARLRFRVLAIGTAMTSVAVGTVGIIGFVGLVSPHIARRMAGADLRLSIPGAAFVGASLLPLADLLAQRLLPGSELPVGAVAAVLGAPALLLLLRARRLATPGDVR